MNKTSSKFIQSSFLGVILICFLIIIIRLFYLQVLNSTEFSDKANSQHLKSIVLPAQRGEILSRDLHGDIDTKLATNTTLDMLYIDPYWIKEKDKVITNLTPLIFQSYCSPLVSFLRPKTDRECAEIIYDFIRQPISENISTQRDLLQGLIKDYLTKIINTKEVTSSYIGAVSDENLVKSILALGIAGLVNIGGNIYADPTQITNIIDSASKLSPFFPDITKNDMKAKLERRPLRYVRLARRLDPEISNLIDKLDLDGVVLVPEYWRYYPEKELASQVIGFVDNAGKGNYGIEEYFDDILKGQEGSIKTENDPFGRNITTKSSSITQAKHGAHVHVTIDRIVQKNVEEYLNQAVKDYNANDGQVLVMEVGTGKIIAMANAPNFDPNLYGNVYQTMTVDEHPGTKGPVVQTLEDNKYKVYENYLGPEAYSNKVVSESYEPGSIFKAVTVSTGLDIRVIDPQTPYVDKGEVEVDEYTIKNVDKNCIGNSTVLRALIYSCNVGLAFISDKIGSRIFYSYIKDSGFGEKTGITLPNESAGDIQYFRYWGNAKLATAAFGQGITVTVLQMAQAYQSIANAGILVKPYIVDKILYPDGYEESFGQQTVSRIFSKSTADTITGMLVRIIEEYTNRLGQVPGYYVAGKTGTAQIASSTGGYEEGVGTTIVSFVGFLPAFSPRFVVITKLDRPRTNIYANTTAAPLFSKIGSFLMNYYNIPRDIN